MKMQGKTLVKAPAISYRPESQLLNRPTVIRRPPDGTRPDRPGSLYRGGRSQTGQPVSRSQN